MTHVFVNILQITEKQKHLDLFWNEQLLFKLIAWQKTIWKGQSHDFARKLFKNMDNITALWQ